MELFLIPPNITKHYPLTAMHYFPMGFGLLIEELYTILGFLKNQFLNCSIAFLVNTS